MSATRTLTLADVAAPRATWLRDLTWIAGASAVTALAAQIAIPLPWTPVPVTGQTFAVLLSGAVLGSRRGALAQLLYLAEGAVGLPVFAGWSGGAAHLVGPSGGYLVAFPLAAAIVGTLCQRGWDRRFGTMLVAMLLGGTVIFAVGLAQLARFVPAAGLLAQGLLPFVPGDLVKSGLAAAAFPAAWRVVAARDTRR